MQPIFSKARPILICWTMIDAAMLSASHADAILHDGSDVIMCSHCRKSRSKQKWAMWSRKLTFCETRSAIACHDTQPILPNTARICKSISQYKSSFQKLDSVSISEHCGAVTRDLDSMLPSDDAFSATPFQSWWTFSTTSSFACLTPHGS